MPLKPFVSIVLIVALLPRFVLPVLARAQTISKETTTIAFADVGDVDKPFPRWATYAIVGGVGWVVTGVLLFFGVMGPGVG